jgi:hypothetical protein
MSRAAKITLVGLGIAVVIGAVYFRGLQRRLLRLAEPQKSEEAARREVTQPPIFTPTDVPMKAKLFWASATSLGTLQAAEVQLPLSADPAQRSRQLLRELITSPPTPEQRTLPADATLLEFYVLPDGTAVADFSDTLATATPSGILSEQMAVDSIARTLEANVPGLHRLKLLIKGQEAETLAGHVDLTGFFALSPPAPPATALPAAPSANPKAGATGTLTPPTAPGKLGP